MIRFTGKLLVLLVSAVLISGCAKSYLTRKEPDNCLRGNDNTTNVIEVYLEGTPRKPVANPETCHVKAGTEIIWVQRQETSKRISIEFDKGCGSPDRQGNGNFPGRFDNRRNEHRAALPNTRAFDGSAGCERPGTSEREYRYSVSIGGIKGDPSIIIDQ